MKRTIIVLVIVFGIGILYFVNPEHITWLPKCWFYKLTGLQCPACGTQRAIHQLLHLNFIAAIRYNPFLIISLPYVSALVGFQWFYKGKKLQKLRIICFHHTTVNIYLILLVLWWIVRNIV